MHALMIALVALCCTAASAKETAPGPTIPDVDAKPLGAPKPVTTTTIVAFHCGQPANCTVDDR